MGALDTLPRRKLSVALLTPRTDDCLTALPSAADVLVSVEIADTILR